MAGIFLMYDDYDYRRDWTTRRLLQLNETMTSILVTTRVVMLLILENYDTQIRGHKRRSMVEQSYQKTKQNKTKKQQQQQKKTKTIILVFFQGVWEIDYDQSLVFLKVSQEQSEKNKSLLKAGRRGCFFSFALDGP